MAGPGICTAGRWWTDFRIGNGIDIEEFITDVVSLAGEIGQAAKDDPWSQESVSWMVAGIAVLANWVGSNQDWFPYRRRLRGP